MIRSWLGNYLRKLLSWSLAAAIRQQGRAGLVQKLEQIVPDISAQYSNYAISSGYLVEKIRAQHAFQIALAGKAIARLQDKGRLTVVDIGDSAGTHIRYLNGLYGGRMDTLSINLDPVAVDKIRSYGLQAIQARAEDLSRHPEFAGRTVDIFLSYEMLEHLLDPIGFLHSLAVSSQGEYFVISVPYVAQSRVGLHQLRRPVDRRRMSAENTHIFELSPGDWRLLFQLAGWEVVDEEFYRQYPRWHLLHLTKPFWRWIDFEGFYGVVLRRNDSDSSRYEDWS